MSMPALMPADVMTGPRSTQRTASHTASDGNWRRKSSRSSQCVVTRSVRTTPLAASKKQPVHTDAVICAVPARRAIQARVSGHCCAASTTPPGMTSTSTCVQPLKSASGSTCSPARARTGASVRATARTSNKGVRPDGANAQGRWCTRLAVVKTS